MNAFDVESAASWHLDDIYNYTAERWNHDQAGRYIGELFAQFEMIAARRVPWRVIPDTLGVDGFRRHYRRHFIYWRATSTDTIAIMAILHDSMEQGQHLAALGD